jgi:hypothetical protein
MIVGRLIKRKLSLLHRQRTSNLGRKKRFSSMGWNFREGQLKESRTVKLLRQQFGKRALGLEGIGIPEYFPGHMLTDAKNAKIMDGIVGTRLPKSQIKAQWWTVA